MIRRYLARRKMRWAVRFLPLLGPRDSLVRTYWKHSRRIEKSGFPDMLMTLQESDVRWVPRRTHD